MSFWLTNDIVAFMDVLKYVFRSYLYSSMIMFINDIPVYCRSREGHMEYLMIVLRTLRDHGNLNKFSNVSVLAIVDDITKACVV